LGAGDNKLVPKKTIIITKGVIPMKKMRPICVAIVFCMLFASIQMVGAVDVEGACSDGSHVVTAGSSIWYIDEEGNYVVEDETSSAAIVSDTLLGRPDALMSTMLSQQFQKTKAFDGLTAKLDAQFKYEAGYSVSPYNYSGTVTYKNPIWEYVTVPSCSVSYGAAGRSCRVTFNIKVRNKNTLNTRNYSVWIECSSSGVGTMG